MRQAIADGPRTQQILNDADAVVGSRMPGRNLNTPTDETARIRTSRQSRPGTVRRSDVRTGRNQPRPERPAGFTAGQERQAQQARQVRTRLNNLTPGERRRIIERADPRLGVTANSTREGRGRAGRGLTEPRRGYFTGIEGAENQAALPEQINTNRVNQDRFIPSRRLTNRSRRDRANDAVQARYDREEAAVLAREAAQRANAEELSRINIRNGQERVAARNRIADNFVRQGNAVNRVRQQPVGEQAARAIANRAERAGRNSRVARGRNLRDGETIRMNNANRRNQMIEERPTIRAQRSGTSRVRNGANVRGQQLDKGVDFVRSAQRRDQIKSVKDKLKRGVAKQRGDSLKVTKSTDMTKRGPVN